jgi:uncharacterized membrane protein
MSMYLVLKWLHVISATVLFGTGLGIAFFQWFTFRQGNVHAIAAVTRIVVRADFLFTTPAVLVQLITGWLLVQSLSLPWTTLWVASALSLYVLVGACWLPVVVIQIRLARLAAAACAAGTALPEEFHRSMRIWFLLGWPAFVGMLAIFWLMVAKPTDLGL